MANRHGADHVLLTAADGLAVVLQGLGPLTPRELDVLEAVAAGLTNKEVAERLVLSSETVKQHVTSCLRKLEAPSRAAAVATAYRRGLLRG